MERNDFITFDVRPKLRSPYIVCGLNGWVNGGDVSVAGVNYLIKQFKAVKFSEMLTSHYHVYQVPGVESLRPVFRMQEGIIAESSLPKDEFYYALNPEADHDLILFLGNEPNLYWEEYADAVVGLGCDFGATRLYSFGGILDRSPYTREPKVSCTCTDAVVKTEMQQYSVSFSSREGPATFNQMLIYACAKRGLGGATFTTRVPYYPEFNIAIDYSPRSVKAVLVRLDHLMHLGLDFGRLDTAIGDAEGKLDFMRRQNQQFASFMDELEKEYIEMPYHEPLDISPHDAVNFAEQILRESQERRQDQ